MPSPEHRSERQPPWEDDQQTGLLKLGGADFALHLHLTGSHERYFGRERLLDGLPTTGMRQYILGRPYIQTPDYRLSVNLYPQPDATGAIGKVRGTTWSGLRRRDIGQAQAWIYPAQRVAVLWECFLNDGLFTQRPAGDHNLNVLWQGFEQALITAAPETGRIITPSSEDIYELSSWHEFLYQRGYRRFSERAFAREVGTR
jgi:hypothetical protein